MRRPESGTPQRAHPLTPGKAERVPPGGSIPCPPSFAAASAAARWSSRRRRGGEGARGDSRQDRQPRRSRLPRRRPGHHPQQDPRARGARGQTGAPPSRARSCARAIRRTATRGRRRAYSRTRRAVRQEPQGRARSAQASPRRWHSALPARKRPLSGPLDRPRRRPFLRWNDKAPGEHRGL
jgi:hypothetical protein